MFIKFDDAFASFQLWLRANPNAAAKLPSKSFADAHDGRAFVQKYAKEWTNEMLFAYLLVAGCAEGSTFNCDDLVACATESQQAWLNGGDKTVRYRFQSHWDGHNFANSLEEMKASTIPYIQIHTTSSPKGDAYVSLAKVSGTSRHRQYGVLSTGILERVIRGEKKLFVWKSLSEETAYFRRSENDLGTDFSKYMAHCFAKLYRISLKSKPKKVKPSVVSKAVEFHTDQMKLLAVADQLAVKLQAFRSDLENGNLNKQVVTELYWQFEELQRNTTETKKTHKRFVGETAEDTRKLAEAGLTSEK